MTEPRITVLMPLKHYHQTFLAEALDSVSAQTSPRWRLLVVYDGDEAKLREALGAALADERARLIPNEGRWLGGAVNTGMRHATTDFVAILLGDDMWAPDAVGVLTEHIERHPEVDFFYTGRRAVDGQGRAISGELPPRQSFSVDDFVQGSPVKHLLCWRREKGLAIGGVDETIRTQGPDDYDFPWTMAEHGARFMPVAAALYVYRDHRDSFRNTTHLPLSTHTRELRRILRKHGIGWWRTERRIAKSKRGYLRQCLYRTPFDRWLKQRLGHDPQRGWRQRYR